MNKLELITALKEQSGISKAKASTIVELFFDTILDALSNGDRVEVRGLCIFCVKEYESYTGRNPRTGEKVQTKPKKLPFFKPGKELKARVAQKLPEQAGE